TPPVCDPWLGIVCAQAEGSIQINASLGLGVQQTVSNTSVAGFIGPFGTVTGTVTGSVCVGIGGDCHTLGINVQLSGTVVIANLSIGGNASATLTDATHASSDLGFVVNYDMGGGRIDLAFQTCALGGCATVFSTNVANWSSPISRQWSVAGGGARTHCL